MKKSEIEVGHHYLARVSGKLVTVRVDGIRESGTRKNYVDRACTFFDVTNLNTSRKLTFRSAAKFRNEVKQPKNGKMVITEISKKEAAKIAADLDTIQSLEELAVKLKEMEGKQIADPTTDGSLPQTISAGNAGSARRQEGKQDGPFDRSSIPMKKRGGESSPAATLEDRMETPVAVTSPTVAVSVGAKRAKSAGGSVSTDLPPTPAHANGSPVSSLSAIESAELGQRFLLSEYRDERPLTPEQSRTVLPGTPSPAMGLAAKLAEHANRPVDTAPHIVVRAYAGTGKTFTQIVGVAWAFGGDKIWPEVQRMMAERINAKAGRQKVDPDTFRVIPSDEQQAVWNSFAISQGKVRTVTYCAFNKSIVTEFSEEWGWLVKLMATQGITLQFATVNSLGNSVVSRAFGRLDVKDWHTSTLLSKHLGKNPHDLKRTDPVLVSAVSELVGLCKLNLTGWTEEGGFDADAVTPDKLDDLIHHYDIELNGQRNRVYDLVPTMLKASLDPVPTREIDYNDQNWLPMVLNLPIPQVDFLLIDEGQDLPRCKQEFGRRLGRRVALVGDVHQAIYGFAGADVDSIPRMERLMGVEQPLTLTETRRCGKAIVEEARKIVPGFKAHASNGEGSVRTLARDKYSAEAEDRDMVLCRVNAPLISEALRFIKAGRKAVVRGREFGKSIIEFVTKLKADSVPNLVAKVDAWHRLECDKENAKRNPSEQRLINFADRRDCVLAFTDGSVTVQEVLDKLDLVFAGKQCPRCRKHFNESLTDCFNCRCPLIKPDGVLFSSVHRAKGLEAKRVFILSFKGAEMPHPMARSEWQQDQEQNCLYIARTRAIEELVYVR